MRAYFILYVADQERSTAFYKAVLASEPLLHVPGMTEFALPSGAILGLVPEGRIKALLGPALPDPSVAHGTPRAELYLLLGEPAAFHERALRNGARELSALAPRDWGHTVAYSLDPDGHVIAFARATAAY
jgi:catechol 2,3-dioxygenase-like lactoylglutathione lyase family enzyme